MVCDNKSVGVIIEDNDGNVLMLKRARFPIGISPVAGHVDDHGSPEQTATDEVQEELGLNVRPEDLLATEIQSRRVDNQCRRPGGDHHYWWVYKAKKFSGELHPDKDETLGARWYSPEELRGLANRTQVLEDGLYHEEKLTSPSGLPYFSTQRNEPGLERVWLDFLTELGYL